MRIFHAWARRSAEARSDPAAEPTFFDPSSQHFFFQFTPFSQFFGAWDLVVDEYRSLGFVRSLSEDTDVRSHNEQGEALAAMLFSKKAALTLIVTLSVGMNALKALPPPNQVPMLTAIAWSSDGHYLATGDDKGHVICWDVSSGQPAWEWQGSTHGVYKLYFDSKRRAFLVIERFGDVVFIRDKSLL
jgi:WD40 repeat protein